MTYRPDARFLNTKDHASMTITYRPSASLCGCRRGEPALNHISLTGPWQHEFDECNLCLRDDARAFRAEGFQLIDARAG